MIPPEELEEMRELANRKFVTADDGDVRTLQASLLRCVDELDLLQSAERAGADKASLQELDEFDSEDGQFP